MKPLAGGAIEDGRLALRYVLSNPAVTVSIPGMATVEELNANVAGAANTAPLTPEEEAACQKGATRWAPSSAAAATTVRPARWGFPSPVCSCSRGT